MCPHGRYKNRIISAQTLVVITLLWSSLQHPKLLSIHLCFTTKLLPFYLCLFAILFQAILHLHSQRVTVYPSQLTKNRVTQRPRKSETSQSGKEITKYHQEAITEEVAKEKRIVRNSKSKKLVVKGSRSKLWTDLLPKELIELVID